MMIYFLKKIYWPTLTKDKELWRALHLTHALIQNFIPMWFHHMTSLVAQTVKRLSTMWETQVRSLGREDPLEKEMAIHSSTIAWKIPWTEEPGRLQSVGLQRVGHDWATSLSLSEGKIMGIIRGLSGRPAWRRWPLSWAPLNSLTSLLSYSTREEKLMSIVSYMTK